MKRLVIAAFACAGLAPMIASAQSNSSVLHPGKQAPTIVTGAATARETVPVVKGPSRMAGPRSVGSMMTESHALPNWPRAPDFAEGEVRKVDEAAGKLTLHHAGMESLDMPPMTMVFRVRNPGWLRDLKVGDRVYFRADRVDGNLTVTALERAPRGSP